MAVNFPLNPVDEQRYPDLAAGEAPLENGRVYVYDAAKGIWNLDISEGSAEFLLKHGHDVDDCTAPVVYSWNDNVTFKSDNNLALDTPRNFTVNSDWAYLNADENVEIKADSTVLVKASADVILSAGDNRSEYINRTIEDTARKEQITNKEYVDQRDHILQEEIIKIQEEINALAPSTDRGIWKDAATQIPPEGHFSMRVQGGGVTADYTNEDISLLVIHRTDSGGGYHSFEKDEIGDQIQLFDVEDQNYGLFEITGKDADSNADYVSFDVIHLGGRGDTHPEDDVIIRLFKPPSGGTASEFVKKIGDDMEGPLVFKDNGIIDGSNAQSMPTNPGDPNDKGYRAGLEIRTAADKPIAISHDGSYKSVLDIYKYDPNEPNNRGKTLSIYADGRVITPKYFQTTEFVRTPILKSKDNEDLRVQRGDHNTIELKSNIVEVNNPLQANQYFKLVSDGSDNGKTYIYYNEPNDSYNQIRIQLNKKGSISDSGNTGGGALWYRRDGLVTSALTWGKDGITLSDYADKKLDIGQCPVINVPDPVDEQDATNKRYVDLLSAKIEELEAKIANLGGGGSTMNLNLQLTLSHRSSYNTSFNTGTIVIPNIKTKKIHVIGAYTSINSSGKINITDAAESSQKPVIEYHIIKATNLGPNDRQFSQWELDVALATLDSGFVGYEGLLNNNDMNVALIEGAVSLEPIATVLEFTGIGEPLQTNQEDQVVETEFYRLSNSGTLQTSGYHYGNFYPYKYIENEKGVSVTTIEGATAKYSSSDAVIEETTFNGIDGISVYKNSGGSVSSSNENAQMIGVTVQPIM